MPSLRSPWSYRLAVLALVAVVATAGVLVWRLSSREAARKARGDHDLPLTLFFRWTPNAAGSPLELESGSGSWIDEPTRLRLQAQGLAGKLEWVGAAGSTRQRTRLLVLLAAQIPEPFRLYYPRDEAIVYAFDGLEWHVFPQVARTYSGSDRLEPRDAETVFVPSAGRNGETAAYFW
jgi:hypothetical protein